MTRKKKNSFRIPKQQLRAFFQTEDFRKAAILHTVSVIASASGHDWWSVDLLTGSVIHRATDAVYPGCHFPRVLPLQMLAEADLLELQQAAGITEISDLRRAVRQHLYGLGMDRLPPPALGQLSALSAELARRSGMLAPIKHLMLQQL